MPNPSTVVAKEITRRSEKGTLQPFIIRDTEDELYVVKGIEGAGRPALVAELICAELAKRCGIPVAEHALMEFPDGLLEFSAEPGVSDLQGGPAFASKMQTYCQELTFSQVRRIPAELQQRVLLFDIWVSNEDRYLSDRGGNVNLLWSRNDQLVVIDHNLAFDPMVGIGDFSKHVFRDQLPALHDLEARARHAETLDKALDDWDTICSLVPEEWIYRDPEDDASVVPPTLDERYAWLARLKEPSFWSDL